MRKKILRFRAWDGQNKKFSYWTMNDLCTYAEKDEKPNPLEDWQQDTGLLDCHGKEIYEGDILKIKLTEPYRLMQHDVLVVCEIENTGVKFYSTIIMNGIKIQPFEGSIDELNLALVEVIGNIYENPDLPSKVIYGTI